ncbi:MAG TPA: ATP-binding cassette domain-containing protein [Anaerolineales bacterium]|nr:ATP-binding cassette domain-containing protein [Anaerolineales bacterium]
MSIILSELTKRFGENLVVNKVSLEIQNGELFVLLGSSGSGKSTILRMIAGLTEVDAGRIELDGRDVTFLPPQTRGTGFVFQNYSIFRHMTVLENIEFGLRIRKTPLEERRQRSEELLELVGLSGLGSRFADQISGGQRQRVALARALAYQPAVLLLDEPFGALDVKIRAQLRERLIDIQRQLNVTTILVTHDQEEAFELGDRIGVIERGDLIEVGNPEELYHRPKTEFVATFIGNGNVLVGRAEGGQVKLGSTILPFPKNAPFHDEGAPVRILFRPETVVLQDQPVLQKSDIHMLAQGLVIQRVFVGSQQRIRLEVDGLQGVRPIAPPPAYGQRMTHIVALQQSLSSGDRFRTGESFWIGVRDYHILAPTGLKILTCYDESPGGEAAFEFGARLAEASRGPTTLLTVIEHNQALAAAKEKLELLRPKHYPHPSHFETRVRQGASAAEILLEAQDGHYEVVVIGQRGRTVNPNLAGMGSTAWQVLNQAAVPVLIVQSPRPNIQRILICTAAGEPGKSDVRFGGRLARTTGAQATVFHIRRPRSTGAEKKRTDRHLRQAQSTLESLKVNCEIKVIDEAPLPEGILSEAEQGDYDLIVVGAPAPRSPQQFRWKDLDSQIVNGTTRPVLIVPMVE